MCHVKYNKHETYRMRLQIFNASIVNLRTEDPLLSREQKMLINRYVVRMACRLSRVDSLRIIIYYY